MTENISVKMCAASPVLSSNQNSSGWDGKRCCAICLDEHLPWSDACKYNKGQSTQAVNMVLNNKNCVRCLRKKSDCEKANNCFGKARNKLTKEFFSTDCPEGCKSDNVPLNSALCKCRQQTRKLKEALNDDKMGEKLVTEVKYSSVIDDIAVMSLRANQPTHTHARDEKVGISMAEYIECVGPNNIHSKRVGVLFDHGATDCLIFKSKFSSKLPIVRKEKECHLNLAFGKTKVDNAVWRRVTLRGKYKPYEIEALEVSDADFGGLVYCGEYPQQGKYGKLFQAHKSEVNVSLIIGQKYSDCFPRLLKKGNNKFKIADIYKSVITRNGILGGCQRAPKMRKYENIVSVRKVTTHVNTLDSVKPHRVQVSGAKLKNVKMFFGESTKDEKKEKNDGTLQKLSSTMTVIQQKGESRSIQDIQDEDKLDISVKARDSQNEAFEGREKVEKMFVEAVNNIDKIEVEANEAWENILRLETPDKYPVSSTKRVLGYRIEGETKEVISPFDSDNVERIFPEIVAQTLPSCILMQFPLLAKIRAFFSRACQMSLKDLFKFQGFNVETNDESEKFMISKQTFLGLGFLRNLGVGTRVWHSPPHRRDGDSGGTGRLNWWPYERGGVPYAEKIETLEARTQHVKPAKTVIKAGMRTVETGRSIIRFYYFSGMQI